MEKGTKLECTMPDGSKFTCKVTKVTKYVNDTIYDLVILDGDNKGGDTWIFESDFDSTIKVLSNN